MIHAGKLDRLITLQTPGPEVDNGYTIAPAGWTTLGVRKAKQVLSRGREIFEQQGIEAEVPVTLILRDDSLTRELTPEDRVIFGGMIYDIKGVQEIGRRRGIELLLVGKRRAAPEDLDGGPGES
jgi:head-tail adaptor